jgi:hypothetical protein
VQKSLQQVDSTEWKRSLEEELKRVKARAEEIIKALDETRASETIEKARRDQTDSNWLKELREQYSEEVCQSTLDANRLFPMAEE